MIGLLALVFLALIFIAYLLGRTAALRCVAGDVNRLHSRPNFHGGYVAILATAPAIATFALWTISRDFLANQYISAHLRSGVETLSGADLSERLRDIWRGFDNGRPGDDVVEYVGALAEFMRMGFLVTAGIALALFLGFLVISLGRIHPSLRTRHLVERFTMWVLIAASGVAILTTLGIVFSLIFESLRFFEQVPILKFLFGNHWSPQSAFEGAGSEATSRNAEVFGAIPVFAGTLLITAIAILIAAPVGLMSAIYLSDYASPRARSTFKPMLEVLAGVPTVVYGFFAALTLAPFIRSTGEGLFNLDISSESALAAGVIMGVMIIPFISSLSDDVINAVPQSMRDGSAALGATKSETIVKVILPAALPGIVSALMLAISRAIGETMIVVMAAGLAARPVSWNLVETFNPFQAVTTVTVQIVTLLVGDQEFDSAKTLSAFALALVLFGVTLTLNIIALRVVQKYREQYD